MRRVEQTAPLTQDSVVAGPTLKFEKSSLGDLIHFLVSTQHPKQSIESVDYIVQMGMNGPFRAFIQGSKKPA